MRLTKTIKMVEAHAEGEVGRIVTGGDFYVPGDTMLSKMNYINDKDDIKKSQYITVQYHYKIHLFLLIRGQNFQ